MSLSLPAGSLPAGLSFTPPLAPDDTYCQEQYANPRSPPLSDCQAAFALLPQGDDVITYHTNAPESEVHKLPIVRSHGICEISFYPSGQAALRSMIPVTVPSETIRDMIGWVVDACVGKAGTGGFVTRYINRTTAFLDNPDSNLDWYGQPPEITFFTAMVRHINNQVPPAFEPYYEPGSYEENVAILLSDSVHEAMDAQPDPSPQRETLKARSDRISRASFGQKSYYVVWWENFGVGAGALPPAKGNGSSLSASHDPGAGSGANVTGNGLPLLVNVAHGDQAPGQPSGDAASVATSRKRRGVH